MAELADALDSGSSESNFMQVQVLFPAPLKSPDAVSVSGLFFCIFGAVLQTGGHCSGKRLLPGAMLRDEGFRGKGRFSVRMIREPDACSSAPAGPLGKKPCADALHGAREKGHPDLQPCDDPGIVPPAAEVGCPSEWVTPQTDI